MANHSVAPFFERDDFGELMERLSLAERVTLVVGAGASVPQGKPSWADLIWYLLYDYAIETQTESLEEAKRFADAIVQSSDLPAAATIARSFWTDSDLQNHVHNILYSRANTRREGQKAPILESSLLSESIVSLAFSLHRAGIPTEILTTNYDDGLEKAAKQIGAGYKGVSLVPRVDKGSPKAKNSVPLRYLHGRLSEPRTGSVGRDGIVLDEKSYTYGAMMSNWRAELLLDRLRQSFCLFVGLSMKDPNLTRYLYLAEHSRPEPRADHTVLMSHEDMRWRGADSEQPANLEMAIRDRFRSMGLSLVVADFYRQIPQILFEGGLVALAGLPNYMDRQAGLHYEARLDQYLMQASASGADESVSTAAQLRMANPQTQEDVHKELKEWKSYLARRLNEDIEKERRQVRPGDLRIELWSRTRRTLARVASSEWVWHDLDTLREHPIRPDSDYQVVQVFCSGIARRVDVDGTRWRHAIMVPLNLEGDEDSDILPVGALVVSQLVSVDGDVASHDAIDLLSGVRKRGALEELRDLAVSMLQEGGVRNA